MPRALPAVAGQSVARHPPAPQMRDAAGGKTMGDIGLTPRYSTKEIPGKCIKCLAEQKYNNCLRELLSGECESKEIMQTYEVLVSFLESPELKKFRDESEKLLAEGRDVKVVLHFDEGQIRYEIKTDSTT
jgi:hypothetical protein